MFKKKIFLSVFLVFSFLISNTFANYTIPYSSSNSIKFNDIVGINMTPSGNVGENIYISPLGDIYLYRGTGGKLYKKGINEFGDGVEFTNQMVYSGAGTFVVFSSDGQYVYYVDGIENSYQIYKKGINEVGNGNPITTDKTYRSIALSPDGQYIFYVNYLDNKTHKLSTSNPVDNSVVVTTSDAIPQFISPDGLYLFYKSGANGYTLYKKDLSNGDNGVAFTPGGADFSTISSDGAFIYYRNNNDGMKLYKKGINEVGNGIAINSLAVSYYKLTQDNSKIIYTELSNGWNIYVKSVNDSSNGTKYAGTSNGYNLAIFGNTLLYSNSSLAITYNGNTASNHIFKIDLDNPQGYAMTDNIYTSNEISNANAGVYIKTDTTLPSGTDYEFWLANQNTQEIVLPEGGDVDLMGDRMMSMMGDFSGLGLNIGDSITLYKTGEADIDVVITQVDWEIRFNNTGKNGYGWGIKKGSANFQKLNNSVLDGNTEINTQTIFGNVTDKLFYKIVLIGDTNDTTKTPVINSVNITATPQTVVTPPGNTGNTTSTGGVNLGLGDGTSISIPSEKQTTDFIKSLATLPSINPSSLNSYSNVEKFLKDNNYDYKNQILIGSGSVPDNGMYTIVNLGFTDNSLSNTLSGAINSTNYSKLILTPETYLAGKRIINYLKMDKADDNGNLIISVYNSDTREYIFIKPKN